MIRAKSIHVMHPLYVNGRRLLQMARWIFWTHEYHLLTKDLYPHAAFTKHVLTIGPTQTSARFYHRGALNLGSG